MCRGLPPSGWRAQTVVARAREVLLVDNSSAASRNSGGECRQAQARTWRPCQRKAGSVGGKADVAPALTRSSGDHGRCQCQDGGCRRRCAVTTRRAQGWQARTPVTAHVKRGVPAMPSPITGAQTAVALLRAGLLRRVGNGGTRCPTASWRVAAEKIPTHACASPNPIPSMDASHEAGTTEGLQHAFCGMKPSCHVY